MTFESFSGHDLLIAPKSGGQIRAKFKVPWGREAVSTASAEWSGLDSHAALRLANVDPQAIGAAFNGSGTFTFSEPRRFTIVNRSTGRAGRGVVPMTGTINATIVGDDYSYDHDHALPGFTFEGRMKGRINRGAATLQHHERSGARAGQRRGGGGEERRDAGVPGRRRSCTRCTVRWMRR